MMATCVFKIYDVSEINCLQLGLFVIFLSGVNLYVQLVTFFSHGECKTNCCSAFTDFNE